MQISHLLYADDTLIFYDAKAEQVSYIRVVLVIFEAISGLAMNWGEKQHLPSQGSDKYSDVGKNFAMQDRALTNYLPGNAFGE